jgi:hypothetical protein
VPSVGVAVRTQPTNCGQWCYTRCLRSWAFLQGGFHSMGRSAASALLADGATPAVVQKAAYPLW